MIEDIREKVKERYAQAITQKTGCCGDTISRSGCCCGSPNDVDISSGLYIHTDLDGIPADMLEASFGCGNPTLLAQLNPGEVVLDLGSGAGLDVLLSAKRVGPSGKAYGLDMTDEMLAVARSNQSRSGVENAEFLKGHIEDIPLPDGSIDVIISNCVINLSADKNQVFKEAYRVLKPGGRLAVADIVLNKTLPERIQRDILAWAGCVAGALLLDDYKGKLVRAGFKDIDIEVLQVYDEAILTGQKLPFELSANEKEELKGAVLSAFIRAVK